MWESRRRSRSSCLIAKGTRKRSAKAKTRKRISAIGVVRRYRSLRLSSTNGSLGGTMAIAGSLSCKPGSVFGRSFIFTTDQMNLVRLFLRRIFKASSCVTWTSSSSNFPGRSASIQRILITRHSRRTKNCSRLSLVSLMIRFCANHTQRKMRSTGKSLTKTAGVDNPAVVSLVTTTKRIRKTLWQQMVPTEFRLETPPSNSTSPI